jgi:hypothetical protein
MPPKTGKKQAAANREAAKRNEALPFPIAKDPSLARDADYIFDPESEAEPDVTSSEAATPVSL